MAAAHAGTKRSYRQMHDVELDRRRSVSTAPSERDNLARPYSQLRSRASTPLETGARLEAPNALLRKATFEPSASIVLIGIRGVGKSTLGILAATAYNRRLVDTDKIFLEATESTTTTYRKAHGSNEYQQRHIQVLRNTLDTYRNNAVIISSFSDLEKEGLNLVREYAQTHPVIYVSRDAEGIQSHLQIWPIERIKEIQRASSSLLRSCSNFEFFNLSENNGLPKPERAGKWFSSGSFLTLKSTERDFLRLLRIIIGDYNRGPSHQSAYPLSKVSIQDRAYSFSASVTVAEINSQHLDLDVVQIGADCIELIVDANDSDAQSLLSDLAKAFATLRRATILPILITPRPSRQHSQNSEAELFELTNQCLRLGPELCSVDLSLDATHLRRLIGCKGNSKVIGLWEFVGRPDDGWQNKQFISIYKMAAEIGCDLAKMTMPAHRIDDSMAVFPFKHTVSNLKLSTRLIAYCTGVRGRMSKCFNGILTPVEKPLLREDMDLDAETEHEHVTAKAVTQALFSSFVLQPLHFYIFGADVSHSLSPAMHNAAYDACGMRYTCSTYSSDKLDDFKKLARSPLFGGSAVAHPFKTTVASIVDGLSPHAKAIGAVNTVVPIRQLCSDGSIPSESVIIAQRREQGVAKASYGFNTDWIGIRACIRRGLSPANAVRPHSSALVCGAGGMARSAIYSLISLGVQNILVCNRTLSHAVALAEYYNSLVEGGTISDLMSGQASKIHVHVLESFTSVWLSEVRQPTIIVNCIPRLGDDGSPIDIALPDSWLKSPTGGVVVEVAYRLPVSPLLRKIRERAHLGWIVMDGFDVLPEQAYSQFELFTGRRAPRKLMREEILKHCDIDEEQ